MRYTTHQAKTHLSRLLDEASSGREVIISRGRRPIARLVPHAQKKKPTRPKVGEVTSKPFVKVVKSEPSGSIGDSSLYF